MRRLLIRPGGVGDFIVSLPAMEHLKTEYTEVWTSGANLALAHFADRAVSIVASGLDRVGILPAADVLDRLASFDSIVSWYGTRRPDFRAAVSFLPFQFHEALPPPDGRVHAADFFAEQVGLDPGVVPRLPFNADFGDYAAIHPFSGGPSKNWPLPGFQALARRIQRYMPVHWCCGPEETLSCAHRFPDLTGLAIFLAGARVYIGNDSGISHLAAAVGTPTIAIFRITDPHIWAPRGPNVRVLSLEHNLFADPLQ